MSEYHPLATREVFEKNYLSFHDELPRVLEAPTSVLAEEVAADSCRFVHIDASHLYHHVTEDIGTARNVLLPQGVVVLDDFRAPHTPGVALATWEAVVRRDLNPICVSEGKLYGTWGDPRPAQRTSWSPSSPPRISISVSKCWQGTRLLNFNRERLRGAGSGDDL